jgi:hypothetical protein
MLIPFAWFLGEGLRENIVYLYRCTRYGGYWRIDDRVERLWLLAPV